ncbi:MAG TPA: contractile injection system protein, VgrG/Pvc8 family [bacterium]|nr:contractile injection system protein, VgrG/Pvc8 family [bacterium]
MPDPALEKNRTVPELQILVDGSEIPLEVDLDIQEVIVSDHAEGASWFSIHLSTLNSDTQEFKYIDEPLFQEGVKVEVKLGYDNNLTSLIHGEVTSLEPMFNMDEAITFRVQGYDSLHRFRRGRKTKSYLEMKDSDIARQIASNLGLSAQVEDTQVTHEYILQQNQTDIDFLMERARRIRYELVIEDTTLHFRPAANDESEVVTLEYGLTLQSFYPRLNTLSQVSEVQVKGWDPKTKKAIVGTAGSSDAISKMKGSELGASITENAFFQTERIIVENPVFTEGEANQIAKGEFNEMTVEFITGEGESVGNGDIRAGEVIELTGLGKRFGGYYYVTSAKHVIDPRGYITKFTVERNAT